jgi:hypothetical protein
MNMREKGEILWWTALIEGETRIGVKQRGMSRVP